MSDLHSVRLTRQELWAALSAIEGIWETEQSVSDKSALRKLWAAYHKADKA